MREEREGLAKDDFNKSSVLIPDEVHCTISYFKVQMVEME